MVNLEYLIIFKSYGIPIYSRCFGHFCSSLMKDDILLSGFFSALTTIGNSTGISDFQSISFEGQDMQLEFSQTGDLVAIDLGGTKLFFFYVKINDYYIVGGFPLEEGLFFDKYHPVIDGLFESVKKLLNSEYKDTKWEFMDKEKFETFENDLLNKAIYPWMKTNKSPHTCMMGNNCALRVAMFNANKKSIAERIKDTIQNYRELGMMSKMKMMMSGVKEKMKSI